MSRLWITSPGRQLLPALALALVCTQPAQAALITVGPRLNAAPATLVDPLGTLVLDATKFLVPVLVQDASALESWQFSLAFNADVAAPAEAGGLFQSVYQADFGGGRISQITSSGLALSGLLQDVSGWFAPAISGDGVLAYVLFEYQPGHEGQDPGTNVPPIPAAQLPEPSAPALLLAACAAATGVQATRRRRRFADASTSERSWS